MKMSAFFLLLALSAVFISCAGQKPIEQGIRGTVLWYEGDLMPGIDKPPVEGDPIVREILFYAPVHVSQAVETDHVFYSNIQPPLIRKVSSAEDGRFEIRLEPGTYSVFVREPQGLFANKYNEYGLINPVKVFPGEVTELKLRVDYKAAY